ncbi:MAG: hypothetical protein V4511_11550 [Bacteroidota bacterium]
MLAASVRQERKMKRITIFGLFIISTVLLFLDGLTPLDINNSIIHLTVLFFSISTLTIIVGALLLKLKSNKFILLTILTVGTLCFVKQIFSWGGDWKTQTIIYQNLHLSNRTIEFQMQDIGALGYNKRTIERLRIIPFLDWTEEIDTNKIDTLTWKKVDNEINELGLKGG